MKLFPILEATIKDLIDLNIRENSFDPKKSKYLGFSFRSKIIYFQTGKYLQKVQIPGLKVISRLKGTLREKIELALENDDIKVHCTCPDWKFGGFMYIGTVLDYSLNKEHRPPVKRNPEELGSTCKHLNFLLSGIDKYIDKIEEDYKEGSKTRRVVFRDKNFEKQIKHMGLKKGKE